MVFGFGGMNPVAVAATGVTGGAGVEDSARIASASSGPCGSVGHGVGVGVRVGVSVIVKLGVTVIDGVNVCVAVAFVVAVVVAPDVEVAAGGSVEVSVGVPVGAAGETVTCETNVISGVGVNDGEGGGVSLAGRVAVAVGSAMIVGSGRTSDAGWQPTSSAAASRTVISARTLHLSVQPTAEFAHELVVERIGKAGHVANHHVGFRVVQAFQHAFVDDIHHIAVHRECRAA
ncbi:MAG: hypothetical protein AELANPGJ_01340 [Anaerolineae bacterium]|nr:hypothetical protein [Anaerolineae bacterium]